MKRKLHKTWTPIPPSLIQIHLKPDVARSVVNEWNAIVRGEKQIEKSIWLKSMVKRLAIKLIPQPQVLEWDKQDKANE